MAVKVVSVSHKASGDPYGRADCMAYVMMTVINEHGKGSLYVLGNSRSKSPLCALRWSVLGVAGQLYKPVHHCPWHASWPLAKPPHLPRILNRIYSHSVPDRRSHSVPARLTFHRVTAHCGACFPGQAFSGISCDLF